MKSLIGIFILFSIISCSKKEEIPLEFKNIEGSWVGIDSLIHYTIHFNNKKVEYGVSDRAFTNSIININYSENSNTFQFYCKSRSFYGKFKNSNNWYLLVNMNNTLDTITYKGLKYVRV